MKPFYYQWDGRALRVRLRARGAGAHAAAPHRAARSRRCATCWRSTGWTTTPRTFFEGLRQLPAAHCLAVGEGGLAVARWWSLDPDARATGHARASGRASSRELFTDAVRLRLRADVEVGSCLSGGLDSSAVVTTAARLLAAPDARVHLRLRRGPGVRRARRACAPTVEASGAHSHVVVPDGGDFWAMFDRLAARQDEPTAGPGLYSQWKVMELAHAHGLKVLLDGQGGDETLAGYFRYLPVRLRDLARARRPGGLPARCFGAGRATGSARARRWR